MHEILMVHFSEKGWAIVTMIDGNAAVAAIRDLNGVAIDGGKPIKVSDAVAMSTYLRRSRRQNEQLSATFAFRYSLPHNRLNFLR